LHTGPYPQHLKDRVAGQRGHLSNRQCGEALAQVRPRLTPNRTIWLAHLSQTNNRPEVACATVAAALAERTPTIVALPRRSIGPVWSANASLWTTAQLQFTFAD
nr:hypothetical protein [Chloroflexota bacterium]